MTVCSSSQGLQPMCVLYMCVSVLYMCVSVCQIARCDHQGQLSQVSLLPAERIIFCLPFAICHKKSSVSPNTGTLISRRGGLRKRWQMETAPRNIFQPRLIPERLPALLLSASLPAPVSPEESSCPGSVDRSAVHSRTRIT